MEQSIGSLELMLAEGIVVQINKHHHIRRMHPKQEHERTLAVN